MRHLPARRESTILEQLACSNVFLAFDFDGMLAPIVADRERAAMRHVPAQLVRRVCTLCPCAVIPDVDLLLDRLVEYRGTSSSR